jgi:uncharacterized Fe-S cluster protein YjdI
MFGTTPLAYKGSSTKIHLLSEQPQPQIMLTKTFSIHPTDLTTFNSTSTRRGSFSSSISSSNAEISGLSTVSGNYGDFRPHYPRTTRPMTAFIPDSAYRQDDSSSSSRSGATTAPAVSSSMPNTSSLRPRAPRPGFDVRRLRRASQTSMDNGTFNPTPLPSSISQVDNGHAKVIRAGGLCTKPNGYSCIHLPLPLLTCSNAFCFLPSVARTITGSAVKVLFDRSVCRCAGQCAAAGVHLFAFRLDRKPAASPSGLVSGAAPTCLQE